MSTEAVKRGQVRLAEGIKRLINDHAGDHGPIDEITCILIDIETIVGNLSILTSERRNEA